MSKNVNFYLIHKQLYNLAEKLYTVTEGHGTGGPVEKLLQTVLYAELQAANLEGLKSDRESRRPSGRYGRRGRYGG